MSDLEDGSGQDEDLLRRHFEAGAVLVFFHFVGAADALGIESLTAAEQATAGRLCTPADRAAYVASHRLMRSGFSRLGHSFACDVVQTPGHRPFVAGMPFHFSLSRTRGLVACAFASARPLGLDIEDRDRLGDIDDLVPVMMTSVERRRLAARPDRCKTDDVLRTWTRKEAILKAIGTGLSLAPDTFAVDLDTMAVDDLAGQWRFTERWLSQNVHCTLAAESHDRAVTFHELRCFVGPDIQKVALQTK